MTAQPPLQSIQQSVRSALAEDLGTGDRTADLLSADQRSEAILLTRQAMVLCGRPWFEEVFYQIDVGIQIEWHYEEGDRVNAGEILCRLQGPTRALLTGERTAMNFLQTLSGTATQARRYADAVAGLPVRVLDTRKTIPGLRAAQKYAVACGGCHNHRMGLYDAVLIKENHILAAGSISKALEIARQIAPELSIEIEVENLAELEQALAAGAQSILLDNFDLPALRRAVALTAGQAQLEASGSMTEENIRSVAETGVNAISVGKLTKDLQSVDLSLRFLPYASRADPV